MLQVSVHCGDSAEVAKERNDDAPGILGPEEFAYSASGDATVFSAQFLPGMAYPSVAEPISTFTDRKSELTALFGAAGRTLEQNVRDTDDLDERVTALGHFLNCQIESMKESGGRKRVTDAVIESCTRARLIVEWIASSPETT